MSASTLIGFDADDTLWRSEDGFRANELRFVELVAPYAPDGIDVKAALTATERKNLAVFGYGVKAFGLSMVECAIKVTEGAVPTGGRRRARRAARATSCRNRSACSPDVPEVLAEVGRRYRLALDHQGRPDPPDPQGRPQRPGPPLRAHRDRAGEGSRDLPPCCSSASMSSRHGSAWSATACAPTSSR